MFICGSLDGLIEISGRRHNTEDIIATVMAVEPHSFIYKGRYVREAGVRGSSGRGGDEGRRGREHHTKFRTSLAEWHFQFFSTAIFLSQDCSVLHHCAA